MPVIGDTAELIHLEDGLQEFEKGIFLQQAAERCANEAVHLIAVEFETGTDPYGHPWAPLKSRKGKILQKSGRLAGSFGRPMISVGHFQIGTSVEYAEPHQDGATVHTSARTNFHALRGGRFQSKARVMKRLAKWDATHGHLGSSRPKVKTSFSPAGVFTLPQRMMVPEGEDAGLWGPALEGEMDKLMGEWAHAFN